MANHVATTSAKVQLPIQVIGSDLGGQQFIERTHTLTVHRSGATILLANKLAPDSEVIIHNVGTDEEALARVVGQIRQEQNRHVYALAFLDNTVDLWHVQFLPVSTPQEIVLECNRCHSAREHSLSEIEMEVFLARGDLTRHCDVCHSSTVWKKTTAKPGEKPQQTAPPQNPTPVPARARPEERRKNRRTPMRTTVCIRCSAQEEIASCEDISRGGFRFISRKQYPEGTYFDAAAPYTESGNNIFSRASIVYCSKMPDGRYRHGVAYLKVGGPARQNQ